jgi:hypothetical protein
VFFIYKNMHLEYIFLLLKIEIVLSYREKTQKTQVPKNEESNLVLFHGFPKNK